MMSPTGQGRRQEPGSPRSDTSDSQWCLLSSRQQQDHVGYLQALASASILISPCLQSIACLMLCARTTLRLCLSGLQSFPPLRFPPRQLAQGSGVALACR